MAIEAKISLQNQVEKRLMTEVTADALNRMMRVMADVLEGFDVRETQVMEEKDDLLECYIDAMRVQGRSEKTLARILGHDKIDTTMRYVVLDDEDIKHEYRKFA